MREYCKLIGWKFGIKVMLSYIAIWTIFILAMIMIAKYDKPNVTVCITQNGETTCTKYTG